MNLGPLRALVLDLNISAHGVPVTVTRPFPDDTPIVTTGIWLTTTTDDMPAPVDFQRRDVRRVLAVSRASVATIPRGTLILAPEKAGDAIQRWRVDGVDRQEADHNRVVVVADPDPAP